MITRELLASSPDPSELGKAEQHDCELTLADTRYAPASRSRQELHRRTGKREQAQEHLTAATTMYREMDMRFWLKQAEAEMRELA